MASAIQQLIKDRKESIAIINKAFANPMQCYVIHYSCESFYNQKSGQSTRITSIALRNLANAQTHHWALNRSAELLKIDVNDPANLDKLETDLLNKYFEFIKNYSNFTYIHWNMRDNNYGFQALQHRYEVLGGTPFILQDDKKVDLARLAVSIYGRNYIGHEAKNGRKGRMLALVEKNKIADKDVMTGEQEAEAYTNAKYRELEMSTLRKVDVLCNIAERINDKSLKTNNKWYSVRSYHPLWILESMKEHWILTLMGILIVFISIFQKTNDLITFFTVSR
ncbi:TPA: hypothetical protein PXN44_002652 [Yersinia enterocolitica]|nr:hypothetical protein [Yersinia enterocolitica]